MKDVFAPRTHKKVDLHRRDFLIGASAGGLALGLAIPCISVAEEVAGHTESGTEVNAWVIVKPDDTIVIRVARAEMGQGTLTGLAQLVAEELECDWNKVTTEYPTPAQNAARNRVWGDMVTASSAGIRRSHDYVRKGGAAARMMLIKAAADLWNVNPDECTAKAGIITHLGSARTVTFGQVAQAASRLSPPTVIELKDPKSWKLVGTRTARLDTRDKTTGKMIYGIDFKMPGMLHAAIRACPVFGGKLRGFDENGIARMKGVRAVLRVGDDAAAVVADTWWHAKSAVEALSVQWDEGPNAKVSSQSISEWLDNGLNAEGPTFVGNERGDVELGLRNSTKTVEAVYSYPYQNHATMEPMNATAHFANGRCDVWVGTQNPEGAYQAIVAASGLPADKCDVHRLMLGGGFGRRLDTDHVRQAVLIAKQMPGIPIKLLWSREEDMRHGKYHPISHCRMIGAFDSDRQLSSLRLRVSGQSIRDSYRASGAQLATDPGIFQGLAKEGDAAFGYSIPNLLIEHVMRNPHVPPGYWRGVNINQNAFYAECFIDELAHESGQDPLAFRRNLLAANPKQMATLNAAADKAGWGKPAPPGSFRGVAQYRGFGSYVATIAEISVLGGNKIKVKRMVAAIDPGYAVNPSQIERQIAGSFVYGLSALFHGGCTVRDGAIEQSNFDNYGSMRIADMPVVETVIVPSGGFWGGVGEPTIGLAAPAVLNAFYAATGRRIRSVPLRTQGITFA